MTKDDAGPNFNLALELFEQKKIQDARDAINIALALHPSPPADWYFRLGRICESGRDWGAARTAYLRALLQRPSSAKCQFQLGQVEFRLNNLQAAEDAFELALAIEPARLDWYGRLALCLKAQGKNSAAVKVFRKVLPLYAFKVKEGDKFLSVDWANALFECGYYEDGLSVLVKNAGVIDLTDKFESVLSLLVDALSSRGDIHLAFEGLSRLKEFEKLEITVSRQYLKLCVKYAYFEEDALEAVEKARSRCCTDLATKESALSLAFLYYGSTLALADEFLSVIRLQEKLNRSFALNLAGMLFVLGEYERLGMFCRNYPELWVYCGDALGVAYFVAHADDEGIEPGQKLAALEVLGAYEMVQQAEHDIFEKLADVSLSVAIVGNSPCELGRNRGAEIDSHDIVVRFNNFSLESPYNVDYGGKVDWVVRVGVDKPKYENGYRAKDIVFSGIRPYERYRGWSLVRRLISEGNRVCFFPQKLQQKLIQNIRRAPSAGLVMVWIAHHKRSGCGKISYYGFSFLDQIGPKAETSHYFESSLPVGRHAWKKEALIFEGLSGRDMKIPENKPCGDALRIKLIGDHSTYHAGCAAVVDYLLKEIQTVGVLSDSDDYDILLVNGEGSMHHDAKNHKNKMAEIEGALGRGKRAYLINTVWQSNGSENDLVLKGLDGIVVREKASHDDLLENHGVKSIVRIDVSYWADVDDAAPFRDLGGAVVVGDFYSKEFGTFVKFTGGRFSTFPYVDMRDFTWSGLVNTLRTASILVTGRHHAVFAACRARIPFVVMQGNTHKIEGMIQMSGLPIPVCKEPSELVQCMAWVKKNKSVYDELFLWMDNQPKLSLADLFGIH